MHLLSKRLSDDSIIFWEEMCWFGHGVSLGDSAVDGSDNEVTQMMMMMMTMMTMKRSSSDNIIQGRKERGIQFIRRRAGLTVLLRSCQGGKGGDSPPPPGRILENSYRRRFAIHRVGVVNGRKRGFVRI